MFRRHPDFLTDRTLRRLNTERIGQPLGWAIAGGVILVLCGLGDFANFRQTVESLLAGTAAGWLIMVLSVFGTAVVIALPLFLARFARERHDGIRARPVPMLAAMAAAWAFVVVGVTYVRIVNEVGSTPTPTAMSGGVAGTSADLTVEGGSLALTAFLTVLLLATGAIGFALGWTGHDVHAEQFRATQREYVKIAGALSALDAQLPQFEQAKVAAEEAPAQDELWYEAALASIDAIAGRFRQLAREAIAIELADPGASTVLLQEVDEAPRWDEDRTDPTGIIGADEGDHESPLSTTDA